MKIVEELEHQYTPSRWCKRVSADKVVQLHLDIASTESESVRAAIQHKSGIRYGERDGQLLDIFGEGTLKSDAEIFVYIHGGYWHYLSREVSAYCVRPLFEAGIKTIIPDYDLAPKVNMDTIVTEIKELVNWVLEMAEKQKCRKFSTYLHEEMLPLFMSKDVFMKSSVPLYGLFSCAIDYLDDGVWFGGHSAGAHLAGQLLNDDYLCTLKDSHKKLIQGVVLISGIYDLKPLVNTSYNEALQLSRKEIEEYSPLLHGKKLLLAHELGMKVLIAIGENESPAFHQQSESFAKVLRENEVKTEYFKVINEDHFSIVENLKESDHLLTKWITNTIKAE